jgi:hypothetical protein
MIRKFSAIGTEPATPTDLFTCQTPGDRWRLVRAREKQFLNALRGVQRGDPPRNGESRGISSRLHLTRALRSCLSCETEKHLDRIQLT